jgi:hypothetical protein
MSYSFSFDIEGGAASDALPKALFGHGPIPGAICPESLSVSVRDFEWQAESWSIPHR